MKRRRTDGGYVLLLVLLAMMGVGGVVLAGFTQQVKQEAEQQRYEHNQRVLREAKQALLMYAYRYPEIAMTFSGSIRGPGRLPCPDIDDSGTPDPATNCIDGFGQAMVGRFPWNADGMEFYDARDADGERLWYAVSGNFSNFNASTVINSADRDDGSITLFDQSGRRLYDGSVTGIAAVIIAPGSPTRRDENNDGNYEYVQDRLADPNDPRNFLDTFGAFDNSSFVNGSAADADGFIMGPVFDTAAGDIVVNDQIIIVTADEVIDLAEKKVLETYRDAIDAYLVATGNVYPWLFNYNGVNYNIGGGESVSVAIDKLSDYFPHDLDWFSGTNYHDDNGRVPSIFTKYFTDTDSIVLQTRLSGSLSLINPITAPNSVSFNETFCEDGCPQGTGGTKTMTLDPVLVAGNDVPRLNFTSSQVIKVTFNDYIAANPVGRISASFPSAESFNFDVYFWDDDNTPTFIWTACAAGANSLMDCSRDASGNLTPGVANGLRSRILHIDGTLNFSGIANFDVDYSAAPTITITPATSNSHARITASFDASNVLAIPGVLSANYEFERHWHEGEWSLDPGDNSYATGTVNMTGFTLGDLTLQVTYYPELPAWAYSNEWHNAIRMAYAPDYRPGVGSACNVTPDDDCLKINSDDGGPRDKESLLVIAGQHNWQDTDSDGLLADELLTVFDDGNHNGNYTYYTRRGNDRLLVIEELP